MAGPYMVRPGQLPVTLKPSIAQPLRRFIKENDEGYTTPADFITDLVRDALRERGFIGQYPEQSLPERSKYLKDPRTLERR